NGSGSTGASADPAAVAAKVTPGIVNINVTLSGGGGAAGTGMIITSTGEVLTNNHVIDGETSMTVELPSTGKTYSAHVLGYDLTDDVALAQIDGGGSFTTVSVGNSSAVNVGDAVVALGNALGKNGAPSVTTGNVTALDRTITASDQSGADVETVSGLIQVDAQIQPGDSGGPLTDANGNVIGMDTAAQSSNQFNQGVSSAAYAIPINKALSVVRQIQSGQSTANVHVGNTRALLGVGAQDGQGGVRVSQVQPGSAAAQAGITVGSVITALNGTPITTNAALRNAIVQHAPGSSVSVSWTDTAGNSHTAQVTLGTGPPA
ncbi:MAG TPA: trypsin-like peptidase domain-containing protein, partial [Candidatus Dormibacteraeota bacterium]|nr:trypsin-like peptidase domain-containing protein [Candidatus Dormibacteraeota bacterium]